MSCLCLKDDFSNNLENLKSVEYDLRAINILSDVCFRDYDKGNMSAEDIIYIMRFLMSVSAHKTYKLKHYLMDYGLLFAEKD